MLLSIFRSSRKLCHVVPQDRGTEFIRNVDKDLPIEPAEHTRRLESSSTLLYEPHTLPDVLNAIVDNRGHSVAQLVQVMRYKPEGRGFDS